MSFLTKTLTVLSPFFIFLSEYKENGLTFAWMWGKLPVETGVLPCSLRLPSSFSSVISAKAYMNPPSSSQIPLLPLNRNIPARSTVSSVLLGVSLSFSGRFLAGPIYARMGRRPAFLSRRCPTFAFVQTVIFVRFNQHITSLKRSDYGIQNRMSLVQPALFCQ